MEDNIKVHKTINYDKFKLIRGNRAINKYFVKDLVNAIAENNLLEFSPIIVNEKYEVIDGQHRLEVARQLKVPIYYLVSKQSGLPHAQLLNSNIHKWNVSDYLESYISQGYKDYEILKDFGERHNLTVSNSMFLLTRNTHLRGDLFKRFKDGSFKIKNLEDGEKTAMRLHEVEPYCENGVSRDREFIRSLFVLYSKKIRQKLILKKLSHSKVKFTRQSLLKNYLRLWEDFLNYKRKKEAIRLY